jgi:hypothetical protein
MNNFLRLISLAFIFVLTRDLYAEDLIKARHEVNDFDPASFSNLEIQIPNGKVETYVGYIKDLGDPEKNPYIFKKTSHILKGLFYLNGYVFAKEFVESKKFPNAKNKKMFDEYLKIFNEKNIGKMIEFLFSVNELKDQFSPKGFIEISSIEDSRSRYFIKMADLKKEAMILNVDELKINILKATTAYAIKDKISGLNLGNIESGDSFDLLTKDLLNLTDSICGINCTASPMMNFGGIASQLGKILTFEVVGNGKIPEDKYNEYVLLQQWCMLDLFSEGCRNSGLEELIYSLELKLQKLIPDSKNLKSECLKVTSPK